MPELFTLGLARPQEANRIAVMSRDLIEHGLEWTWTTARVRRCMEGRDHSVVVARREGDLAAFAVLRLNERDAHLNLLAVASAHRRQGLGRRLIEWLCATVIEAGVFRMDLELRLRNAGARAFYESLGFVPVREMQGYYQGRESALRMSLRLATTPC